MKKDTFNGLLTSIVILAVEVRCLGKRKSKRVTEKKKKTDEMNNKEKEDP